MADALKNTRLEANAGSGFLHQTLHGYSEGHRLLEGSITVPDDQTRLMLRMSDLSGSNLTIGFEDYITGYPLASLEAYALAKTWYAPEMTRPGCVWTHTIVIPAALLGDIPALFSLQNLFRRPSAQGTAGFYSKPIPLEMTLEAGALERTSQASTEVIQTLLALHYGTEDRPVLIPARTSTEFDEVVFAVWSQKWPSLRMSFTFSTGSLAARNMGKRPFDIQCLPTAMTRKVLLEIVGGGNTEPLVMNALPSETPDWTDIAAVDAASPTGGELRAFLWKVADASSGRADFALFVRVFEALREVPTLASLMALIAKLFPQPSAGRRLKILLLNGQRDQALLPDLQEEDVLLMIGTTADSQSFDAETLILNDRATQLYVQDPDAATWLVGQLFQSTLNSLGEAILAGLISAMEPANASQVTKTHPQLLPGLFRAKPSLASSAQLWKEAEERKRELFESVVSREKLDSATVGGVIEALLESGSDTFIRRALDHWGRDAVFRTLDWMELKHRTMSELCREALASHLPEVMDWIEQRPTRSFQSLVALAHVVGPHSKQILHYDSSVWARTFHYLLTTTKEDETLYVCALLLALGFGNAPPSPLELVSESFERVHESARGERLSDSAWIIVEPYVPELSWLSNWDKCERLRRGLISAFVRHKWPISELHIRVKNTDLLDQLQRSARRVEGGDIFSRGG